jgi:hypothetical protein
MGEMQYELGQRLLWRRDTAHDSAEVVEVVSLRKRGAAVLSNGWMVNDDGIAEGTARVPGGRVSLLESAELHR